jgi:hypothetical protein
MNVKIVHQSVLELVCSLFITRVYDGAATTSLKCPSQLNLYYVFEHTELLELKLRRHTSFCRPRGVPVAPLFFTSNKFYCVELLVYLI